MQWHSLFLSISLYSCELRTPSSIDFLPLSFLIAFPSVVNTPLDSPSEHWCLSFYRNFSSLLKSSKFSSFFRRFAIPILYDLIFCSRWGKGTPCRKRIGRIVTVSCWSSALYSRNRLIQHFALVIVRVHAQFWKFHIIATIVNSAYGLRLLSTALPFFFFCSWFLATVSKPFTLPCKSQPVLLLARWLWVWSR